MPEVDQALARELEALKARLGGAESAPECALAHATAQEEVEEENRLAREVNAWAVAGCRPTLTTEEWAARAETARARALGRRYRAEEVRSTTASMPSLCPPQECRRGSCMRASPQLLSFTRCHPFSHPFSLFTP